MNETPFRIMIIDDNPAIHQDFIKVLTTYRRSPLLDRLDEQLFGTSYPEQVFLPEFHIDTAAQGKEGVEKIRVALQEGRPYALAFVDVRMPPGWDGLETIKRMWEIDKDIQAVICTAYSDYSWEETVEKLGMSDNLLVLKKPFDKVAVRQLACALTRKWILSRESKDHTNSLNRIVKERTESLQQSLSLVRATIESSTDGILVVDLQGNIIDHNNKLISIFNISQAMIARKNQKEVMDFILKIIKKPKEFINQLNYLNQYLDESSLDIIKLKKNKIVECYSQPHRVNDLTVGRIWSFRDITERTNLEAKLAHQAMYDSLTDLPNRMLLDDRVIQAINNASRHKDKFALLFLDLDRFKLVNDSLSHAAGDEVLRMVALRLSTLLRGQDTLARLGGDEFVILITELKNEDGTLSYIRRILEAFNQPFCIDKHEIVLSTSIGVSFYPEDGETCDSLLSNSDLAMYQAKEHGGNQFHLYTNQLNHLIVKRVEMEAELRQALLKQEFFILYQPQFDMQSENLLSVEALIRWQHPQKGVILPLEFIPIAEESGLIIPIGEWVIREVCAQIGRWQSQDLPPINVAVNASTKQLKQAGFAAQVADILQEFEIDPQFLEIEITENVIITHREIHRTILELRDVGVKIVLDDFGTGNSSLNYLRQIQIDRLKIDQSFIQNINKSRSDEVIIKAIIAMAQSFKFKVLAEGVETKGQMNFLREEHCDEIQGFLLSKPVSSQKISWLLQAEVLNKKQD